MKKIICTILILLCVFGLLGCGIPKRLTLDKVVELSEKGLELTWSDFEEYEGYECGSGLYIMCYGIDKDYEVRIGGFSPGDKVPMYVYLIRKNGTDKSEYIDIRKDDVKEFIRAGK